MEVSRGADVRAKDWFGRTVEQLAAGRHLKLPPPRLAGAKGQDERRSAGGGAGRQWGAVRGAVLAAGALAGAVRPPMPPPPPAARASPEAFRAWVDREAAVADAADARRFGGGGGAAASKECADAEATKAARRATEDRRDSGLAPTPRRPGSSLESQGRRGAGASACLQPRPGSRGAAVGVAALMKGIPQSPGTAKSSLSSRSARSAATFRTNPRF